MNTRKASSVSALLLVLSLGTSAALAQDCTIQLDVGDNLMFSPTELSISKSECANVTVNLTHGGTMPEVAMGHNFVLTLSSDADAAAQDGWQATLENEYLKPDDGRLIAATDIIGGGEKTSITFTTENLEVGGEYTYFCSFVGHSTVMRGPFTVTE